MSERQQLQVQKKREQEKREETTIPARVFLPTTDIYEAQDALTVILEMPGVEKSNVSVGIENGVLNVEGRLDLSKYQGLQPLYIEYNIGHYSRNIPTFPGNVSPPVSPVSLATHFSMILSENPD
jgi:HSP20 family protein